MNFERTELHQQVVQALIETGAVNFEAMGSVFSKFAQDAATRGEGMTLIVNKFTTLACGPIGGLLEELPNVHGNNVG
jgi:hypothetical protein